MYSKSTSPSTAPSASSEKARRWWTRSSTGEGAQVLVEHVVVDRRSLGIPLDLLRSTVVAGMRIDGEEVDPFRRGGSEDHRRTAAERSDLDDLVTGPQTGRTVPQSARLVVGHPSVDLLDGAERLAEGADHAR